MRRDPEWVERVPVSQGRMVPPRPAMTKMALPEILGRTAARSMG
jgi:hypothetical protein